MVLLRLFVAWRLLRFRSPLIVCGALLLALTSPLRSSDRVGARRLSIDGAVLRVGRGLEPLLRDARNALRRVLLAGRFR